jgi:fumarate reductase subunit D
MAISNKPLVWLPFAAGGMIAALLLPAVMLVVLADSLGLLAPEALGHGRVHAFASHPLAALVLFGTIAAVLWHAAHRLRMTAQDLGVRGAGARRWLARGCYLLAALATLGLAAVLVGL